MVDVHFMLPDFSPVANNVSKNFHGTVVNNVSHVYLTILTLDPELVIHGHNHTLNKNNDTKRRRDDRALCM